MIFIIMKVKNKFQAIIIIKYTKQLGNTNIKMNNNYNRVNHISELINKEILQL